MRAAIPRFSSPISPRELAALARRLDVESRLVLRGRGRRQWELRTGPFTAADFRRLPERRWTLLVQEVDRHVPEVASLLQPFRFVPNWRVDDIMVSYAVGGGGVGPHVDRYDVFLLQGLGRRRWEIGARPIRRERLIPGLDLRVLAAFRPGCRMTLEPGDLLYLPPGFAHHGVAVEPSITFSLGFRAPAHTHLLAAWAAEALEQIDPAALYADPDLKPQREPGTIAASARARIRAALRSTCRDAERIDRWFGRHVTAPTREQPESSPRRRPTESALLRRLRGGAELRRSSVARFAFFRGRGGRIHLFVGGREYTLAPDLGFAAPLLTGRALLDRERLAPHLRRRRFVRLLADLIGRGFLLLPGEPDTAARSTPG